MSSPLHEPELLEKVAQAAKERLGQPRTAMSCVSVFAMTNVLDTRQQQFYMHECHSPMRGQPGDGGAVDTRDILYTGLPVPDEYDLLYQTMLINGPFRSISRYIEMIPCLDTYVIKVDRLDQIPANLLYNYVIATRGLYEDLRSTFRHNFIKLIDKGYRPIDALLIGSRHGFTQVNHRIHDMTTYQSNHWWLENMADWSRLVNGTPNTRNARDYKNHPGDCVPCNIIWNKLDAKHLMQSLMGKTPTELAEYIKSLEQVKEVA